MLAIKSFSIEQTYAHEPLKRKDRVVMAAKVNVASCGKQKEAIIPLTDEIDSHNSIHIT